MLHEFSKPEKNWIFVEHLKIVIFMVSSLLSGCDGCKCGQEIKTLEHFSTLMTSKLSLASSAAFFLSSLCVQSCISLSFAANPLKLLHLLTESVMRFIFQRLGRNHVHLSTEISWSHGQVKCKMVQNWLHCMKFYI